MVAARTEDGSCIGHERLPTLGRCWSALRCPSPCRRRTPPRRWRRSGDDLSTLPSPSVELPGDLATILVMAMALSCLPCRLAITARDVPRRAPRRRRSPVQPPFPIHQTVRSFRVSRDEGCMPCTWDTNLSGGSSCRCRGGRPRVWLNGNTNRSSTARRRTFIRPLPRLTATLRYATASLPQTAAFRSNSSLPAAEKKRP